MQFINVSIGIRLPKTKAVMHKTDGESFPGKNKYVLAEVPCQVNHSSPF